MNKKETVRSAKRQPKTSRPKKAEKLPFRIPMWDNLLPFACPKCGTAADMRFDAPFMSDPSWIGWGVAPNRWLCCRVDGVVHWRALIGSAIKHGICWDKKESE